MSIQFEGIDGFESEVYVLLEDGQKTGSINVRFDLCTIMKIHVEEKLRKQGRGTRLVRYVEALAVQKGCKMMRANAVKPEAKEFFEKCGYDLTPDEGGEFFGERTLIE